MYKLLEWKLGSTYMYKNKIGEDITILKLLQKIKWGGIQYLYLLGFVRTILF